MDRNKLVLDVLEQEFAKPYKYGSADCFTMACRVVDGLTGSALVEEFSGRYKTETGAMRLLKKLGHDSLADFWADHLKKINPAFARFGDLVILGDRQHCAICVGQFVSKTELGRQMFLLSDIKAGFRV